MTTTQQTSDDVNRDFRTMLGDTQVWLQWLRCSFERQHTGVDDQVPAHAVIYMRNGGTEVINLQQLFTSEIGKDVAGLLLKTFCEERDAVGLMYASEAFVLKDAPPGPHGNLRYHPDAIDSLMTTIERECEETEMWSARIVTVNGARRLEEWQKAPDARPLQGRLVGLLPRPKAMA